MVKVFSNSYTYKHPWNVVTAAFWGKYPNPNAPHVQQIDTYEREIDTQSGDLTSKRVLRCASKSVPTWMARLGFPTELHCQEESVVNAQRQKLVLRSSNITGSSFLVVEETCSYEVHPENPEWTLYRQEAKITGFVPMFSDAIEKHSLQNMTSQAKKGLDAMEHIIDKITHKGIDALLPSLSTISAAASASSAAAASALKR